MSRVATVIRCGSLVRHVYSTLESVERQTAGRGEIVLATDDSTPVSAREWLVQLARTRGLLTVHAPTSRTGAVRNAGTRATVGPYVMCLDAGDTLDPRFHEACCAKLEEDARARLVTSWIFLFGAGSARIIATPRCDLEELLCNTGAVHSASMFRRDAWIAVGGFDESLACLDDYDFWLRAMLDGARCALVEEALLIRRWRDEALFRPFQGEDLRDAMAAIVERHRTLFARDPASALYVRERLIQELHDRHRELMTRRNVALEEIASLEARIADRQRSPDQTDRSVPARVDLQRRTPISRDWGYERGTPVDRHYIEGFLDAHSADIRGTVLEVQEADYTNRFGGDRVTTSDVLDVDPSNSRATVISDLRCAANIPDETYDCIILTQTLHVVDDMKAVIGECRRILRPGGVLLVTLPCASRVCVEYGHDGDFWRVTEAGARALFSEYFALDRLEISAYGNVLVNAAFLYGLACHELSEADFDVSDPYFPLIVSVRATKPVTATVHGSGTRRGRVGLGADGTQQGAILLYHRVSESDTDVHGLAVRAEEFRAQVAHLRDCYRPMPLDELVAATREGSIPAGAVALTFDDGYVDNFSAASPILQELGVPATFFVTTDRLGDVHEFWWDTLERILISPPSDLPNELRVDLPDGICALPTGTGQQRLAAHWTIYHAIVASPADLRDQVIDGLRRWSGLGVTFPSAHRRMTSGEIVALSHRPGHTIGAHSARHLMLPPQPIAVQRREVEESKIVLETLIARPVTAFAYPFGAVNSATAELVRVAGFDVAVTCQSAPLTAGAELLRLPRLEVTRRNGARFDDWVRGWVVPA
jgi:peptidoglycan/xylan/chitin deacetylase (PgdA/CDA1 family)